MQEEKTSFDNYCSIARTKIKDIGEFVKHIKEAAVDHLDNPNADKGEVLANLTLAYRHLEDSAMRLGKAIQAYEGGRSIYDSNDAKRVAAAGPLAEQK